MILSSLFLLIHVAGGLCMLGIVTCQLGIHGRVISLVQLGQLLKLETFYSWSTLLTLVSGLSLWVLQPVPGNAFSNPLFVSKLVLFLLAAVSSVYPSMIFLRLKSGPLDPKLSLPWGVTLTLLIETLALLAVLALSLSPRFFA